MTPEELSELKELVEFLKENEINEFDFERGEFKIRLKFVQPAQAVPAIAQQLHTAASQGIHAVPSTGPVTAPEPPAEDPQLHLVKSPIVGTFYESSSPGA